MIFTTPILAPLSMLSPLWQTILISFVVSLVMTVVYKLMTNQKLMKSLKDDMKQMQNKMKELKNEPKKMMEVQKEAMQKNMQYMMHSMKPTIITFIPLILIFGWLNSNMAYYPITPNETFTTTMHFKSGVIGTAEIFVPDDITVLNGINQTITNTEKGTIAKWELKGSEGEYLINYKFGNNAFEKDVMITKDSGYKTPEKPVRNSDVTKISIDQKPVLMLNLGFRQFGWLGTYIIFSMLFSMGLRKIMNVH